ncbi:MAG: tryptophan synthase subunit alpha [Gammaproteobacteria bacterium]|nr:tryptophan synthase subunit alpha [Gammaproteobacteria bacterium]MBU1653976.1 tryptophan synthase subunit alpha [Gammaproteobacteria bacterium]MBU1960472.1 tryptophan synthase subunit alpha [Gammaproteobacteria bacterium]
MSRIQKRFEELAGKGRTALIPYITAGDPHPDLTVGLMHTLVEAGADILELGVPFSDPMADGPVIQKAAERALVHGVSLRDVLTLVHAFRQKDGDTPVVLMGYLNPVEVMGYAAFAAAAATAGVDGVLTVDMPPEESEELVAALKSQGIDPIYLLAPNSDAGRIERICNLASGFVYYVSIKGVTGAAHFDIEPVRAKLAEIKAQTALPVGVGFGIKDAETAAAVAGVADAVVVGSAIVSRIAALADDPVALTGELRAFTASLRTAMDQERLET